MKDLSEEFKLVERRKRRSQKLRTRTRDVEYEYITREGTYTPYDSDEGAENDPEALYRRLLDAETKVRDSSFARNVFDSLRESLEALKVEGISEILCYGLGNFSQRRSPKYQLALLLSIKRHYGIRAFVYDPAFLDTEIELLKRFDFDVIERNEEGKRIVNEKVTLVYMPHCSTHLTNNLIYANWGQKLNNCILLTNSFAAITGNQIFSILMPSYVDYLSLIRPYVTEIALKNDFAYEEVFNDLNIHIFRMQDIDTVPQNFWETKGEPNYEDTATEFLTADQTRSIDQNNRNHTTTVPASSSIDTR